MKKITFYFCILAVFALNIISATAQEGNDAGAYLYRSGYSIDYMGVGVSSKDGRTTDDYSKNRFYEGIGNYKNGAVLSDMSFFAEKKKDQAGFFDELLFTGTGINDPFTTLGFRMRTFNNWDFKVSYKRSEYVLDRQDSLWSGMHKFNMSRQTLDASLNYKLTSTIGLELNYNGTGRDGMERETLVPYEFGIGSADGTSNIFWMNTPRNDWTYDIGAKLNFKFGDKTNLVIGGGLRKFSQDVEYTPYSLQSTSYLSESGYNNPTVDSWGNKIANGTNANILLFPNANGLIGSNPRNESLYNLTWSDKRSSNTPYYMAQFVTGLMTGLSLTGDFLMESTDYTSTSNGDQTRKVRVTSLLKDSTNLQNYFEHSDGTANQKLDRMMISGLLNYKVSNQIQISARYKMETSDQTATSVMNFQAATTGSLGNFNFKANPSWKTYTSNNANEFKDNKSTLSPVITYAPSNIFNVRGGMDYIVNTPTYRITPVTNDVNGGLNSTTSSYSPIAAASGFTAGGINISNYNNYMLNNSKKTTTSREFFNLYYRPMDMLKLRARFETEKNTASYDVATLQNAAVTGTYQGTQYGGVAGQQNRMLPDSKNMFSVSADLAPNEDLSLMLAYKSQTSKADMKPWVDYYMSTQTTAANATAFGLLTGDISMNTSISAFTANIQYKFDANTSVQVTANMSKNNWSIPFFNNSGTGGLQYSGAGTTATAINPNTDPNNPYNWNKAVKIEQNISDTYIDASFTTLIAKKFQLTLGVSSYNSTGGCTITPNTINPTLITKGAYAATAVDPTKQTGYVNAFPNLDNALVGGPYTQMMVHGRGQYQFEKNFGAALDFQYLTFDEKVQDSYVGFGNYKGNLVKISFMYNL